MYTSLDASRPDPLFWRTLYLHVSALSPAGIVYLFLHQMHSIVGAYLNTGGDVASWSQGNMLVVNNVLFWRNVQEI